MKYHPPYGSTDPNASYVDKDVPGAVRGSPVPAAAIETPQREIVDFILKSGMEPANELQLAHAVQSGKVNYAVAGGTATAFTAALSPAPESYADIVGAPIRINVAVVSGVAPTLNLNGLGNRPVISQDGYPLIGGEMQGITELIYDGAAFRVMGLRRSRSFIMSGITQSVAAGVIVLTNYSSKSLVLPASTEASGSVTIGAADAGIYVLNTFLVCSPSVNNLSSQIQVNGVRVGVNSVEETGNSEGTSTTAVLRLNTGDVVRHCAYTPSGASIVNGRMSGNRLSI
ncbi:hypothetical protein FY152_17615 [Agrobacterium tumefaciens]|nr:hypothetical protein FY152_17615 [Agrobacterium tumefaciens]